MIAPRRIAALGSQRDRYESAYQIQCYSGIAPVVSSSGKKHHVHCRWACPAFLRQTFHEWAQHSMVSSPWAREYYEQQRKVGKRHKTAVRALAFKWIRILFRYWKNNVVCSELASITRLRFTGSNRLTCDFHQPSQKGTFLLCQRGTFLLCLDRMAADVAGPPSPIL